MTVFNFYNRHNVVLYLSSIAILMATALLNFYLHASPPCGSALHGLPYCYTIKQPYNMAATQQYLF